MMMHAKKRLCGGGANNPLWRMTVREVIRMLRDDGWYLARTRGSHHQYRHPGKPGLVTVPGRPGDHVAPKTLKSIRKQAGLP
jgi:predicted RNA binding protein YcfA (HicA-like mRNA interferase family)